MMPRPAAANHNVIAIIWDFDKTISTGYMQEPIFERYGVDGSAFWREVKSLIAFYEGHGLKMSEDTFYLSHILRYVAEGKFSNLTNRDLRDLGSEIELAPGMPGFLHESKEMVAKNARYVHHGLVLEHYVVSTGLRQMIEGSHVREHISGVWACELLPEPEAGGDSLFDMGGFDPDGVVAGIGYTMDNTSKTRALFEINKGSNHEPSIKVNASMSDVERRVPFPHMIYVADGPSDIPAFSLVNKNGGTTLGVHLDNNYDELIQLQEQGRIQHLAEADYSPGTPAHRWLLKKIAKIADGICDERDKRIAAITPPPGHKV